MPNNWRARSSASKWIFLQYWLLLFGLFSYIDIVWKCKPVSRAPETCRDWWTRSWQQECDPRLGKDNRGWKGGRQSGVLPGKRWEIVTFKVWSDGNFFCEWWDGNFFSSWEMKKGKWSASCKLQSPSIDISNFCHNAMAMTFFVPEECSRQKLEVWWLAWMSTMWRLLWSQATRSDPEILCDYHFERWGQELRSSDS